MRSLAMQPAPLAISQVNESLTILWRAKLRKQSIMAPVSQMSCHKNDGHKCRHGSGSVHTQRHEREEVHFAVFTFLQWVDGGARCVRSHRRQMFCPGFGQRARCTCTCWKLALEQSSCGAGSCTLYIAVQWRAPGHSAVDGSLASPSCVDTTRGVAPAARPTMQRIVASSPIVAVPDTVQSFCNRSLTHTSIPQTETIAVVVVVASLLV